MARLELNDITVAYEKFELSNITFSCDRGEIVALIGRNGAGKTTTIDSIICGREYECVGAGADLRIEQTDGVQVSETHKLNNARYQYAD